MNEQNVKSLLPIWRRNVEPRIPHEHDALILLPFAASTNVWAYVQWNPVRAQYEMQPVVEAPAEPGKYMRIQLSLDNGSFALIKRFMRDRGVRHIIGVTCSDKSQTKTKNTLSDIVKAHSR